jgi:hypothetical protein
LHVSTLEMQPVAGTVARTLAKRLGRDVVLLPDRAGMDHIAVAPSGVWVVDAAERKGRVEVTRPLIGRSRLVIGGDDETAAADELAKQIVRVARVASGIPVHGALCFVDADLPLLRRLEFRGFPLVYPKALAKLIDAPGDVSDNDVIATAGRLAERFPPA